MVSRSSPLPEEGIPVATRLGLKANDSLAVLMPYLGLEGVSASLMSYGSVIRLPYRLSNPVLTAAFSWRGPAVEAASAQADPGRSDPPPAASR